ncbi:hypothetical protein [Belnapia moabensis]|uniref:hypothetical protein n=1 Tax=Belnapia moabensis TaxID=365533 RepID=UPI0005B9A3C4|nr:hypothetical protein [Belnapia moabensis]
MQQAQPAFAHGAGIGGGDALEPGAVAVDGEQAGKAGGEQQPGAAAATEFQPDAPAGGGGGEQGLLLRAHGGEQPGLGHGVHAAAPFWGAANLPPRWLAKREDR